MDKPKKESINAEEATGKPIALLPAHRHILLFFLLIHIAAVALLAFAVELGGSTLLWLTAYVFLSWSVGLFISLLRARGRFNRHSVWHVRVETIFYAAPLVVTGFLWMRTDAVFDAAREELRMHCEKDAGLTISRTVTAKGYYDDNERTSNLWHRILKNNYAFIEACDDSPSPYSELSEPGCWRVTKIARVLGQCHLGIEEEQKKHLEYRHFWKDQCFEAQHIDKPSARYGRYSDVTRWTIENRFNSDIFRHSTSIRDLEKSENIATEIYYEINPKPDDAAFPSVMYGCEKFDGGYQREHWLILKVVEPEDILRME